jgi:hypothetical protein
MSPRRHHPSAQSGVAAIKAFKAISRCWALSEAEQCALLGLGSVDDLAALLRSPNRSRISDEVLKRISHIIAIFRAINTILPFGSAADAWIRRGNSAELTGGKPALRFMLEGGESGIVEMRKYLESVRTR